MWHVIFYRPGEGEIPLLAVCRRRADVRLLGVVDPPGTALGTPLAEIMGLPVRPDFSGFSPPSKTHVVTPPERRSEDALRRAAETGSLLAVGAEEFEMLLAGGGAPLPTANTEEPDTPGPVHATGNLDAALKTLGRIGDAHDREALLPWLLSLAMAAVGGTSGSLMLYDSRAEALFIAAARGLSARTLYHTRQPLDTGVAGRVARSRLPELVREPQHGDTRPERGQLAAALCVPLVHDGDLLGVLNVNVGHGEPVFDASHLADLGTVGDAIAGILHITTGDRHMWTGHMRKHLSREFRELAGGEEKLETVLAGWSAALAMALGADHASLGIVLDDGALLLAEGTAAGETHTGAIPQQHPAWDDVLQSAKPVVVRQADADAAGDGDGLSIFFLPIGPAPVRAVLAIRFGAAADAHRFQARAGSVAAFLDHRLTDLLRRCEERDHCERLRALTAFLGDESRRDYGDTAQRRATLDQFLRRLTGARDVVFPGDPAPGIDPRRAAARELIDRVGDAGWLITVTAPGFMDGPSRSCLAVRGPGNAAVSGFILIDKDRLHPGDSSSFTAFDGVLARHLANLPAVAGEPRSQRSTVRDAAPATAVPGTLLLTLAREIDRADRYHVAFSLSAFVCDRQDISAAAHLEPLAARLRTSDLLFAGDEGQLFVVAPEETHAVAHLEQRAVLALREVAGDPELVVRVGRALYPGRDTSPEELVDTALHRLTNRSRDDD
ncbi:GAF domain-containing protein [bacterium]|nr:GAF domain-containing protein [bacterium]MBU1072428.1 GAF domain-containing protein [bacterium]MBU1674355.1 GAF domain-containing protein [bacterium]